LGRNEVIVADTHAFFWWAHDRPRLSDAAREALDSADRVLVSTITCWEISLLAKKGRITLDRDPLDWIAAALMRTRAEAIPLDVEAAVRAPQFEQLRDPADQMIVATALFFDVALVTKDERIRNANVVPTIW
jgi:PIN domain nuclease of toxin-antitoxin system